MKGGSKIDGSHLEPIADRDYMVRGKHQQEIFSLKIIQTYSFKTKLISKKESTVRRYNCKLLFD